MLSWFYISYKLIASLLRQYEMNVDFKIQTLDWLSQQTCNQLATNVEPALRALQSKKICVFVYIYIYIYIYLKKLIKLQFIIISSWSI